MARMIFLLHFHIATLAQCRGWRVFKCVWGGPQSLQSPQNLGAGCWEKGSIDRHY